MEYPCTVIIGQKETRKTDSLLRELVIPAYKRNNRPVLIVAQEKAWSHLQYGFAATSSIEELKNFCTKGKGIMMFLLTNLRKPWIEQVYTVIGECFRDGTLILEDCTSYVKSNAMAAIQNIFVNNKNFRFNVFMSYHTVNLPDFVRDHTSHIRLHKSHSAVDKNLPKYERYYASCFDEFYEAWKRVQGHTNHFYHETIETGI